MAYYHGTSSNYLPGILKDGLEYKPDHKWNVVMDFGSQGVYQPVKDDKEEDYIFVTTDATVAHNYAVNRAAYESSPGMKPFTWTCLDGHVPAYRLNGKPPVSGIYPVVLEVGLSPIQIRQLAPDPKDDDSYRFKGTVAPANIRVIWEGQLPKAA